MPGVRGRMGRALASLRTAAPPEGAGGGLGEPAGAAAEAVRLFKK